MLQEIHCVYLLDKLLEIEYLDKMIFHILKDIAKCLSNVLTSNFNSNIVFHTHFKNNYFQP